MKDNDYQYTLTLVRLQRRYSIVSLVRRSILDAHRPTANRYQRHNSLMSVY